MVDTRQLLITQGLFQIQGQFLPPYSKASQVQGAV